MIGGGTEHVWWLCKYVPDPTRNEPRIVGAMVRRASDMLGPELRFLESPSFLLPEHADQYKGFTEYWTKVWGSHGQKAFHWLTKQSSHSPNFRWEFAGSRIATSLVFDELFRLLVEPENR
jgi:hypothetical protein